MGSPSLPKEPKAPSPSPSLLDPTVLYAREREKSKAKTASGRGSTILSSAFAPMMPTGSTKGAY